MVSARISLVLLATMCILTGGVGCQPVSDTAAAGDTSSDPFSGRSAAPEVLTRARRVVAAHGGIEAWQSASTLRYTQSLFIPGDSIPWVATETVENTPIHRLYQDWSSHGGSLTWDGREVWTVDWGLPNPPRLMPFLNYYALVTPWLTLDPEAVLEAGEPAVIPGEGDTLYETLTVRLPADQTRPPTAGYYRMYLDPEDGRMRAMAYTVTYGPLLDAMGLPPEVTEMGPIIHVYESYESVGGLLLPTQYRTVGPDAVRYGDHRVEGWRIDAEFDERRMSKPAQAVVDSTPHSRQVTTGGA
jgi:hypothetical protein